MTEYIGGTIFKNVKTDSRVTSELKTCLYCKVYSQSKEINYEIPLVQIGNQVEMKQCPACKAIYILKDEL